jgi:hypothetical protein
VSSGLANFGCKSNEIEVLLLDHQLSSETNTAVRPVKLEKLHARISALFVTLNLLWSRGCPWWSMEGHFSKTAKRLPFLER